MRPFLTLIIPAFLCIYLACKSKKPGKENGPSSTSQPLDSSGLKAYGKTEDEDEFNYSDFNDLKRNTHYERFFAGNLNLITGHVVCTDPLYRELGLPQTWTVKPGNYPVYLYIGLDGDFAGRIAYAELVIKDEIPAKWLKSLIPEHLLTDSFEKKMNGLYPVENGVSSFSDFETFKIYNREIDEFYSLNKNGNFYNDILELYFKKNADIPKSSRGEDWADYKPKNAKANIIMFGSGLGDGLYARYVGYDKNKNAIKLITDFIRFGENSNDE